MKHTIELNGKHYDALTGELIGHSHKDHAPAAHTAPTTAHHTKPATATAAYNHRKAARTALHHKGRRSRTLMRAGLKKPLIKHVSHSLPKTSNTIRTIAQLHRDSARLTRASKIQQSKLVSRFGSLTGQTTYSHQQ